MYAIMTSQRKKDFIFIFGSIKDVIGKFLNLIYQPQILFPDGAEQITNVFSYVIVPNFKMVMCWTHVGLAEENHLKLLNNSSIEDEILAVIGKVSLNQHRDKKDGG